MQTFLVKRDLLEKQELLYQKVFTGITVNWFLRDGIELNGDVSSLILILLLLLLLLLLLSSS